MRDPQSETKRIMEKIKQKLQNIFRNIKLKKIYVKK